MRDPRANTPALLRALVPEQTSAREQMADSHCLVRVVESNLVKEWRVYADNKPVYEITAKSKPRS
jgi:hypothetical protein